MLQLPPTARTPSLAALEVEGTWSFLSINMKFMLYITEETNSKNEENTHWPTRNTVRASCTAHCWDKLEEDKCHPSLG